jgi:hypothetical protein
MFEEAILNKQVMRITLSNGNGTHNISPYVWGRVGDEEFCLFLAHTSPPVQDQDTLEHRNGERWMRVRLENLLEPRILDEGDENFEEWRERNVPDDRLEEFDEIFT